MAIQSVNPASGEVIREYPEMDAGEVNDILAVVGIQPAAASSTTWCAPTHGCPSGA